MSSKKRQEVWFRFFPTSIGYCLKCNRSLNISDSHWHASHIVPKCKDGGNEVENLIVLCANCNLSLGKKDLSQFCKTIDSFPMDCQD
jgi:5-methylcytosine-specific restriction endonuclease McrA